jgi:type I restriction enzyme M protein
VEDRAYLKAVVSLPQETFISSGASVKASLLFLQKYADEIASEIQRLEDAIAEAKVNKDAKSRKLLEKELKNYIKKMEEKKAVESRKLLKERFDYPIFMYEAEKVGISATGEEDQNELYPNENKPKGIEKTCLEWYREFRADPKSFEKAGS